MSWLDRLPPPVLKAIREQDHCELGRLMLAELKRQRAAEYADCEAGYGEALAGIPKPEAP